MLMSGAGIDLEADIYSTKLASKTSPQTPMHEIKGRTSENSFGVESHGFTPFNSKTFLSSNS
jgi:hypothetical protein